MPKTVLVATEKPFAKVAVAGIADIFRTAGYDMPLLEGYKDKSDFLRAVADVDGLIIRSDIVDAEILTAAPRLKIVVRAGAGYDNIDLKAATAHGVVAMNTPGQNSNAVAELAFGLMITLARRGFSGKDGTELRGKRIGIHAYGNVGKYVAMIASGFGMEVFGFDPYVPTASRRLALSRSSTATAITSRCTSPRPRRRSNRSTTRCSPERRRAPLLSTRRVRKSLTRPGCSR
jgi:D-3-phosphoglycerate dehydrogenase